MPRGGNDATISGRQLDASEVEALNLWRLERSAELKLAIAPALIARALTSIGLTAQDLAIATGAHERTTSSWLDETRPEPKVKKHQDRLRELKRVALFVVYDGTIAYQEGDWLRDPNSNADLRTPLEVIGEGDWKLAGRIYCDDVSAPIPAMFQVEENDEVVSAKGQSVGA